MVYKEKTITDEELVGKSLENIDFFETLINRYEERLMYYIMRISSFSREDAEEVLQEVYINAWKNLNSFDQSLSFSSWIYRLTHNQTISSFRKVSSRGLDTQESIDDHIFHLKSDVQDAHALLEKMEDSDHVRKAVFRLQQKYRDVLVLYYFEDKTYAEIADVLKRPAGSVATLLHRAKKKFKSELSEEITNKE